MTEIVKVAVAREEEDLLAALRAMRDRSDPHISRLLAADLAGAEKEANQHLRQKTKGEAPAPMSRGIE